ncbi:glycosyltransferase, partial [Streptomyces sp. NPDC001274]
MIESFHRELIAALEPTRQTFEIVYVDDGSGDGTRARVRAFATADRRVRYTSFSRNFGKEAAMLAGLGMSRGDTTSSTPLCSSRWTDRTAPPGRS